MLLEGRTEDGELTIDTVPIAFEDVEEHRSEVRMLHENGVYDGRVSSDQTTGARTYPHEPFEFDGRLRSGDQIS